jgi:hypothetical protein
MWQSPTPNANGRYWRILTNGHVERMPRGWLPESDCSEREEEPESRFDNLGDGGAA